ncbi:hypothetical protein [Haloferax sp. DFSO60]|uniref:hypothetical protein n=1 Tax=Haloferax sp. DFSO60 TaxID=3388652 RepID=UPI0039793B32
MSEDASTDGLREIFVQEARYSSPWAVVCIVGWAIVGASISLFRQHPLITAGVAIVSWGILVGTVVSVRWVVGIDWGILKANQRMVWLISGEIIIGFVVMLSVLWFEVPVLVLLLYGVVAGIGNYFLSR